MNRRRVLLLAGLLLLLSAAGAYAYWTMSGSGSGSSSAGSGSSITVNQSSVISGLFPGATAATLSGNFDNPNATAVQISSITAVVSSVTGAGTDGTKPNCTTSDFLIGGSVGATTVPAGSGVGSWSGLTIQLKNLVTNQDNCKGATANVTYTANP